ncbi:MAG: phosphoglucosamine mutase [Bdellovibrionales bacterium CG10_big_fil_rev_8_21_14_0_10_45_34]|nr:MAG: phosphoglucosamine mutase [Bdellovibrionales bacterium CG10_big_fil_rev_8_21_14_0_10_45_34]
MSKHKHNKLFGTDGIRGTANKYPMTPEVIARVGQALGFLLIQNQSRSVIGERKVVIGKDTRRSGYMTEMALASGLNSMGVNVQLVGPLPTPGVGFLTRNMRADAGIVISASHNSFQDNGIKIFGPDGFKLSSEFEAQIEKLVFDADLVEHLAKGEHVGRSKRIDDSAGRYIVYVKDTFPMSLTLDGLRIVLDCANGAAYKVGPQILEELGAEVIVVSNQPNGLNINDKCGALYPDRVAQTVIQYRADVGISLDGDADRVVIIDERGDVLNGDHILAICAADMIERGALKKNTVVSTQMSNIGLELFLAELGAKLEKTDVGDKYVVDCMRSNDYNLGGESSGHIIFLDSSTTGDGLIAALRVLAVMKQKQSKLSQLKKKLKELPQVLRNVCVTTRVPLEDLKEFQKKISEYKQDFGKKGRIFVRYSGTEPLIRILVEGEREPVIRNIAEDLATILLREIAQVEETV